jgi:hypothetical protein
MGIGKPSNAPVSNQDTTLLDSLSEFELDEAAHEIFITDGYINSRIVVYDSETGAFKRGWGAYGMPLSQIDNGKAPKYDPNGPRQSSSWARSSGLSFPKTVWST